jgi:methionyl-tRNA synthetase
MRHLITAGLPYINGVKHLGNMIGSMLPADVYARYLRQRSEEVLYICGTCGTDEHGAPAEIAAAEAGEDVSEYCARMHALQADIYKRFSIQFDYFGRTSGASNHLLTQTVFKELDTNGFIVRRPLEQFYSLEEGRYLADRYVIGTCPKCGYEKARGDQCENCTTLLDATDLRNPRSAITGSDKLELRTTTHLFLTLAQLSPQVRKWVDKQPQWPALTKSIADKWLT